MKLRDATVADLAQIEEIYNREIESSTSTFDTKPRDARQRQAWFDLHQSSSYPLVVAEADAAILGWACLSPWSERGAYARTVEASIFVGRDHRRRGIAQCLAEELIRRARSAGHRVILGRIEASNQASRKLLRNAHFSSIGIMHGVGEKFGQVLDVELFERVVSIAES